jgi:divalent metal cation (Fe/Co/Zn/Cd) transporter
MSTDAATRRALVLRGQRLEYFTIGWNVLEGAVSIAAGAAAGSISLVGFGLDSLIEVTSGAAGLWRLHHDGDAGRRERAEARALRVVGACFLALAAYVGAEAVMALVQREAPEASPAGILIAALSVVVMPLLARAKRRVAVGVGSAALHADSRQTDFCAYLSAILLAGLVLNAALGWWWADPVAALAMAPIIAREGWDALRGRACGACGCHGPGGPG